MHLSCSGASESIIRHFQSWMLTEIRPSQMGEHFKAPS